jgi:hypothetical protein
MSSDQKVNVSSTWSVTQCRPCLVVVWTEKQVATGVILIHVIVRAAGPLAIANDASLTATVMVLSHTSQVVSA